MFLQGLSKCPVWTYSLNWTLDLATTADVGCNVADALAKALTDTLQTDQTIVTYLNTSLSQIGSTVSHFKYLRHLTISAAS